MSQQVGVFPLGPNPAMQTEIYRQRKIIESLVGALMRIRGQVSNDEIANGTYGRWWYKIHDGECVICGADRGGPSSDLDTLFCSKHCPVCSGWESVLDV